MVELSTIESGDMLTGIGLVVAAASIVVYGFVWGRWRALIPLAVVWTVPLILADLLYFGFGVETVRYCGEPTCDPGPLPASLGILFLPIGLALCSVGVVLRRRGVARGSHPPGIRRPG
jgi:hypothetical protein